MEGGDRRGPSRTQPCLVYGEDSSRGGLDQSEKEDIP